MIRATITGAGSPEAGELIRILIHHPDVEIVCACEPRLGGMRVDSHHRGLIGDTDLVFSPQVKEKTDVFFVCGDGSGIEVTQPDGFIAEGARRDDETAGLLIGGKEVTDGQCVVDLTGRFSDCACRFVYGVGEINRKPMVRGAKRASLGSTDVHGAILALAPLAQNLLLNSDIDVLSDNEWSKAEVRELADALGSLQSSFASRINWKPADGEAVSACFNMYVEADPDSAANVAPVKKSGRGRGLRTVVELDCPVSLENIRDMFENYYDDHNFTFVIDREPEEADVRNTNKCLIGLSKEGDRLRIVTMLDGAIKGGAGTAVHCMNLLFGLHECIGLQLKAFG